MILSEDDYMLISGIQNYTFCKRQWALMHIERQWDDNYLTAHGTLIHERANSGLREKRNDIVTVRSMPVISHSHKMRGVCDVVEFVKDDTGIPIQGLSGAYRVYPVEYKRGKPKSGEEDKTQLCAQAICLEEMLCCDIEYGFMFYDSIKRRDQVYFDTELRTLVATNLSEMRELTEKQHTPKPHKKKGCASCSLSDLCLPQLESSKKVSDYIADMIKD